MTYGQAVIGVAPSTLLRQRRAAEHASAPRGGGAGRQLDLALMLADGSETGRADPAFDAHADPIGQWATAVWEEWLPATALLRIAADALKRLSAAKNPWHQCKGPAAGFVATATRLGWVVHDAFSVTTDDGTALRLSVDPPAVFVKACNHSVRRWRWRNVEQSMPSTAAIISAGGPNMTPVWKLLRSSQNDEAWNPATRSALRSALANRQWTQQRGHKAGWFDHNRCMLCLHRLAIELEGLDPTAEALLHCVPAAPVGNLCHRNWQCPAHSDKRSKLAPEELIMAVSRGEGLGNSAQERALFPSIRHLIPKRSSQASFEWVVQPSELPVSGKVYTDGSRIDAEIDQDVARLGWSVVVVEDDGRIVASAKGIPPEWIIDIPGAEAWAILQGTNIVMPGSPYRVDCKPCIDAIHQASLGRRLAIALWLGCSTSAFRPSTTRRRNALCGCRPKRRRTTLASNAWAMEKRSRSSTETRTIVQTSWLRRGRTLRECRLISAG